MELEEPVSNFVLFLSISIFIVLLVLLSVSIAMVRCYFQVCAGSTWDRQVKRRVSRSISRDDGSSSCCLSKCCCCRPSSPSRMKKSGSSNSRSSTSRDLDRDRRMLLNSEAFGNRFRRPPPPPPLSSSNVPNDFEEQSKTISIYDVEESLLSKHSELSQAYNKFADYQQTMPLPPRPRQWTFEAS